MESRPSVPGDGCRCPALEAFFAVPIQPNNNSLESLIATILWRWKFAAPDERDSVLADSELATIIEFWFPFSDIEFTRKRGVWCDGVPILEIRPIDRVSFKITGVGHFPHDFSPFELEFHFINRRDVIPRSVILRFGLLTPSGDLRLIGYNKHSSHVMNLRPKTNSEWAVAVELTET